MAFGVLVGRVECSGVLLIECECCGAFCEVVLFFTFSTSPSGITVGISVLMLPVEVLVGDGGVSSWSLSIPGMLFGCRRRPGASVGVSFSVGDGGVSFLGLSGLGMLVSRRRSSGTSSSRAETGRINASSSSEVFEVIVNTNPF